MRNHKKYNYVYEITYPNGMKYIGVRSCNCPIAEDDYLGSAFHIPKEVKQSGVKRILTTHETRELADLEEIRLHKELNVKDNNLYYNQCNANSTKFYPSKEALKRSAEARRGRTKETHEYIRKQVKAREKYVGENRTNAQKKADNDPIANAKRSEAKRKLSGENRTEKQKARDAKMLGVKQGPNPKKGHKGLASSKAKAWWYKEPGKPIVEVLDSVTNYCKQVSLPVTRASISRYLNGESNPEASNSKAKGWKFGHLINI